MLVNVSDPLTNLLDELSSFRFGQGELSADDFLKELSAGEDFGDDDGLRPPLKHLVDLDDPVVSERLQDVDLGPDLVADLLLPGPAQFL